VPASAVSSSSPSLSATEAWTRLVNRALQDKNITPVAFHTWLEPTEALRFDGSTIVVGAPDRFAAEWNEKHLTQILAAHAPIALGHPVDIVFEVAEERKNRPQMDLFIAPPAVEPAPAPVAAEQAVPLSPRYTFEHFIIGKSNDFAAAAAMAVAAMPGKAYNPLFLYGDTGLGKTHLMQAIAHDVLHREPSTRVAFVSSEQFMNEFIAAIQGRTNQEFRRRYREIDLLLMDDVQFLKGKHGTQEEFFHTFNALYGSARQIVLTADRPPPDITGLEGRLVSRFQCGMVADIGAPDLEHRIAILRHKAELDHLETTIPEDVIRFIAEHVQSNVRELEGSIIKLLAFASLKHRGEITLAVAEDALRDRVRDGTDRRSHVRADANGAHGANGGGGLTIDAIQSLVAVEWGVTPDGLKSKTRTKVLTTPRHVAMYFCRELLGAQLVEIGNAFGGRDHSTVIHSLERVAAELASTPDFRARLDKVRVSLDNLRG
jgi:chromosomal replication initiator protein